MEDGRKFHGLSENVIIFKKIRFYGNNILEIHTTAFAFQGYILSPIHSTQYYQAKNTFNLHRIPKDSSECFKYSVEN
jgi:hypothetical protein